MRVRMAIVAAILLAGCTPVRPVSHVPANRPEPKNPDLGAVMERYYQGVTSERWAFVHAMLAPKLADRYDTDALKARYGRYRDADVQVQEAHGKTMRTTLRTPTLQAAESATLTWAGDHWEIAQLAPATLPK